MWTHPDSSLYPLELKSRMSDISFISTLSKTNSVTCRLSPEELVRQGRAGDY